MKLVIKFGGTSISTANNIRTVAKYLNTISKNNQVITVCSALSGITDDLLQISRYIKNGNKENANKLATKLIKKHKQIAKETITKASHRKKLLEKLDKDLGEFEELLHGIILIGEVTPRTLDYLVSFGERLSINLVSFAFNLSINGNKFSLEVCVNTLISPPFFVLILIFSGIAV